MLALGACSDDTEAHTPGSLAITSGTNQTVATGAAAGTPLVATLLNENGAPMQGITIGWTISPTAGGTIANNATVTNSSGQATATYTAVAPTGISGVTAGTPVAAGTVTITAQASGLIPVTTTITVTK
jgi:hypothetical protein